MTGLSVDVDIDPSTDLFGKSVTDLQNVYLSDNGLKGTLKHIADYSSAYGSGEDSGNYAVIHAEVPGVEGVTLTVQVVGGTHGPQTLDSDGICICRITNKSTQTIKVVASKDGYTNIVRVIRLNGLTLETAG